jgi:threonine/homoserine/homoserine lactone efflux protein
VDHALLEVAALLFHAELPPQFIKPKALGVGQVLLLGATAEPVHLLVLAMHDPFGGRLAALVGGPRYIVATNRMAAGLVASAGAGLAQREVRLAPRSDAP